MDAFIVSTKPLRGTSNAEVKKKALNIIFDLTRDEYGGYPPTKLWSDYFNDYVTVSIADGYWSNLTNCNAGAQMRKARLLPCALEALMHTNVPPSTILLNRVKLHRFKAKNIEGTTFYIHVRERADGKLSFISVFPEKPTEIKKIQMKKNPDKYK